MCVFDLLGGCVVYFVVVDAFFYFAEILSICSHLLEITGLANSLFSFFLCATKFVYIHSKSHYYYYLLLLYYIYYYYYYYYYYSS